MDSKLSKKQISTLLIGLVSLLVIGTSVLAARQNQEIREKAQSTDSPTPTPWVEAHFKSAFDGTSINTQVSQAGFACEGGAGVYSSPLATTSDLSSFLENTNTCAGVYTSLLNGQTIVDFIPVPREGFTQWQRSSRESYWGWPLWSTGKKEISFTLSEQTSETPSPTPSYGSFCQTLYNKIQTAYFSSCGDDKYDSVADIDKDRQVRSSDIALFRSNQDNEQWCSQKLNDQTNPCEIITPTITSVPTYTPNCQNLYDRILTAYFSSCGDVKYDPVADIDKDRQVRSTDTALFRNNQDNESWCAQRLSDQTNPCTISPTPTGGLACQCAAVSNYAPLCSNSCTAYNTANFSCQLDTHCQRSKRVNGDANGDEKITLADYGYYRRIVLLDPLVPEETNADFNGDGETGTKDGTIVLTTLGILNP